MDSSDSRSPAVADLVFVAFNSRVAGLRRDDGTIVWQWKAPKGRGAVAVMLDGDRLIASVQGYTYGLDAATGRQLWQNDMQGFGFGIPCLASFRSSSMATAMLAQIELQRRRSNSAAPHTPPAH
ncbi:MAG: PQQ-binding-like beta-propeller repeat protein [Planctomycetes bacterium]|nr:PQQ-binding-like beta-propeller repeat protein [Planctomycetota bacterium]